MRCRIDGRQRLFEFLLRRIAVADVTESMRRLAVHRPLECGRKMDRRRDRAGLFVRATACVNRLRFKSHVGNLLRFSISKGELFTRRRGESEKIYFASYTRRR